ncbi:MAG: hypothetical protein HRT35_21555 [Algicola sp.]|nr:hypothetical protein [Algicola sp.]
MSWVVKLTLPVVLVLSLTSTVSFAQDSMASKQQRFNQTQEHKVLIKMSLKEMFIDANVRKLADAAGDGDIDLIEQMLAQGVDVNARGTSNATPLFWAMKDSDGFKKLLEAGADPNVVFDDGGSVMHWAARMEDSRFLALALKHQGNPDLRAGMFMETPLFSATGRPDNVALLVQNKGDINARSQRVNPFTDQVVGETPVMDAAQKHQFDTVLQLLKLGADHQIINGNGKSLLDVLNTFDGLLDPKSKEAKALGEVDHWLKNKR